MKMLIIGSEGFIGKHCTAYFSSLGYQVFRADVVSGAAHDYTCLPKSNTDFEGLFKSHQYDICINASGSAHVGFSFEKPETDFELNVLNVHKLLVAIRAHNPSCKLINFSSAAVYGNPARLPITADQPKNPLSPYGFHKLQSEYLLKEYHRFFGLATCNLRIFSAYGPGLRKQLFWDLYQKSLQPGVVKLFGNGNETRDFIYIDDLTAAIHKVIEFAPFKGESLNVASGFETSIREAVSTFYKSLQPDVKFDFTGEVKMGDPDNWVADISELISFGFKPAITVTEGLTRTAAWMKEAHT